MNQTNPMMIDSFINRVRATISENELIKIGDRVIVGLSGGADSVALLKVLVKLQSIFKLKLYALHVDHALRKESRDDAEFAKRFANSLDIPIIIERHDVAALSKEAGWSLEEGARNIRYRCFYNMAVKFSINAIALAHTADDQAETVLMRLIRGAGLSGLSGIPVKRLLTNENEISSDLHEGSNGTMIVRPLLNMKKTDVLEFIQHQGLAYCEDISNQDQQFMRNRIRHELLPLLERNYNPNMTGRLIQLAEQSRCDAAFLESTCDRLWKRLAKTNETHTVMIQIPTLLRQSKSIQRQLIRRAIKRVQGNLRRFEFRHWLEVELLLHDRPSGTIVNLPSGVRFERVEDKLICQMQKEMASVQSVQD